MAIGSRPATHLEVVNPATLGTLAEIGDASPAEGVQAVQAAHDAFADWGSSSARFRAEILRKAFDIMTAEIEDCARLISLGERQSLERRDGGGDVRGRILPVVSPKRPPTFRVTSGTARREIRPSSPTTDPWESPT